MAETLVKWVTQGHPTRSVHKEPGENRWRADDRRSGTVTEPGESIEPVAPWAHFGYDMVGIGLWFDLLPILDYDELLEETDACDL